MAEPLKATFFTLTPRDRAVLAPATGVFVVLLALIIGAFVALNWGFFSQIQSMIEQGQTAEPSSEESARMMMGMFALIGSTLLFLFPLYFLIAAYEAACLRWMIRGEAPGLYGLTFDHDMWRVYGIYWCWFLMHFVISMVMSIVTMPIIFMSVGDMMNAGGEVDPEAMWRWQWTVQLPLSLLQYIPMIFLGVRFAPAAATSVARKRFAFFDAWKVTEGRFWELLGSFALLWLIGVLAIVAASMPATLRMWPHFTAMWSGAPWGPHSEPSEEAMQAYFDAFFAPETLIWAGLGYAIMAAIGLGYALMAYGINARTALVALEEGKIEVYKGED